MAQMCPAKSTIVPFKKQMYSSGSIILSYKDDKCICVSIHAPTRGATPSYANSNRQRKWFQSTHPRGVRQVLFSERLTKTGFNPRTHEGCDNILTKLTFQIKKFQSTHPRGVRQHKSQAVRLTEKFQSTHPRGVRHDMLLKIANTLCFNPRTHEGCDQTLTRGLDFYTVSIHAPTRGATQKDFFLHDFSGFQSTHPRGVRQVGWWSETSLHGFNPRTHEGCD